MYCLKSKLKIQCPCGYHFELCGFMDDAISMVKSHVESFHKDILPFGISNDEARELINQGHKPKVTARSRSL
jgi:hypothetical protein